jgi:hypothetical protein
MPQDKFQEQILKSSPSKLPEDIKTELPSLALMAQARCYSMAEALAKKYPNLKDEFQNQIEKKISKKAKMFTQQGFAPPADMTPFPPPGAPPQGIPLAPPQDTSKVPPAASPAK